MRAGYRSKVRFGLSHSRVASCRPGDTRFYQEVISGPDTASRRANVGLKTTFSTISTSLNTSRLTCPMSVRRYRRGFFPSEIRQGCETKQVHDHSCGSKVPRGGHQSRKGSTCHFPRVCTCGYQQRGWAQDKNASIKTTLLLVSMGADEPPVHVSRPHLV